MRTTNLGKDRQLVDDMPNVRDVLVGFVSVRCQSLVSSERLGIAIEIRRGRGPGQVVLQVMKDLRGLCAVVVRGAFGVNKESDI